MHIPTFQTLWYSLVAFWQFLSFQIHLFSVQRGMVKLWRGVNPVRYVQYSFGHANSDQSHFLICGNLEGMFKVSLRLPDITCLHWLVLAGLFIIKCHKRLRLVHPHPYEHLESFSLLIGGLLPVLEKRIIFYLSFGSRWLQRTPAGWEHPIGES